MQNYYFLITIDGTVQCYDQDTNTMLGIGDFKYESSNSDFWTRFCNIDGQTFDLNIFNGDSNFAPLIGYVFPCKIDDDGILTGECGDNFGCVLEFENESIFF